MSVYDIPPHPAIADLAARVAALEAAQDLASLPSSWPDLTEAEKAGFTEALAEAKARNEYRILNAPLNPDEVRHLLRECVTVVKPGETLVIRGHDWTPMQAYEVQRVMDAMTEDGTIGFKALVVGGDELAVVQPEPAFMAEVRTDTFRSNRGGEAVRLTHLPTGLVAEAATRDAAVALLAAMIDAL